MLKVEKKVLCLYFILALILSAFAKEKLILYFFGSPTCGECLDIKQNILLPLSKANPDKIELRIYDVDSDSGFNLMMKMEEKYGVKTSASIELFLPDTFLTGSEDIHKHGKRLIEYYLSHPEKWRSLDSTVVSDVKPDDYTHKLKEKFESFSFVSILLAGLVDGINPCAIATLIFLVSFLATRKKTKKEIIIIGIFFTASVFLTYLLLGIGAFRALVALEHYRWLSKSIKWLAIAFAAVVGILSFADAIVYSKSKKSEDIKLQLPKPVKLKIHKIISGNLSGGQLATGAIVTGFLVTLLEAVCTGQVYLPTIVLMTKQKGLRLVGWLYLIFYNFLFVLPLIIVMLLAYFGMRWEKLSKMTQKNMVLLKVLLGVVLLALALFLAVAG
ncbi:MAG: hypothetical protein N2053_03985 [Chitinispirillaceae bacterium]|nr:hypothetical protein [Chitinispirillaceae bacterium]